jgi:hypothetical protein
LAIAAGLAGCGGNESDLVKAKVREFARATAAHAYERICHDVLAPALLSDMAKGGIGCTQALSIGLRDVSSPRLAIGSVTISGNDATVLTISQARGQKTVLTSLKLVRTGGGWRISALGSPLQ